MKKLIFRLSILLIISTITWSCENDLEEVLNDTVIMEEGGEDDGDLPPG